MKCQDALLIALTLALVLVLVYQCGGGAAGACTAVAGGSAQSNFGGPPIPAPGLRKPAAAPAPPAAKAGPEATPEATPEQAAEAERELWYAASEADAAGGFDSALAQDAQADPFQYHAAAPSIDYGDYTKSLIIDERMAQNHAAWVKEMKPFSGVAMRVDDLDEASEASTEFLGLRRPQPVAVNNPLQLTERDESTYAKNPSFRFRD